MDIVYCARSASSDYLYTRDGYCEHEISNCIYISCIRLSLVTNKKGTERVYLGTATVLQEN